MMIKGKVVLILMAVVMLTCTTADDLIKVGDKKGWTSNVNYTEWASHKHFYVGTWLYFVFDKHVYNVLEVNETNYKNCDDREFIANITRGGRDVFNLTEARPYYFLSSGGYCFQGMKLAIKVEQQRPSSSPNSTKLFNKNGVGERCYYKQGTTLVSLLLAVFLSFLFFQLVL